MKNGIILNIFEKTEKMGQFYNHAAWNWIPIWGQKGSKKAKNHVFLKKRAIFTHLKNDFRKVNDLGGVTLQPRGIKLTPPKGSIDPPFRGGKDPHFNPIFIKNHCYKTLFWTPPNLQPRGMKLGF